MTSPTQSDLRSSVYNRSATHIKLSITSRPEYLSTQLLGVAVLESNSSPRLTGNATTRHRNNLNSCPPRHQGRAAVGAVRAHAARQRDGRRDPHHPRRCPGRSHCGLQRRSRCAPCGGPRAARASRHSRCDRSANVYFWIRQSAHAPPTTLTPHTDSTHSHTHQHSQHRVGCGGGHTGQRPSACAHRQRHARQLHATAPCLALCLVRISLCVWQQLSLPPHTAAAYM